MTDATWASIAAAALAGFGAWKSWYAEKKADESKKQSIANGEQMVVLQVNMDGKMDRMMKLVEDAALAKGAQIGAEQERARVSAEQERLNAAQALRVVADAAAARLAEQGVTAAAVVAAAAVPAPPPQPQQVIVVSADITGKVLDPETKQTTGEIAATMSPPQEPKP